MLVVFCQAEKGPIAYGKQHKEMGKHGIQRPARVHDFAPQAKQSIQKQGCHHEKNRRRGRHHEQLKLLGFAGKKHVQRGEKKSVCRKETNPFHTKHQEPLCSD